MPPAADDSSCCIGDSWTSAVDENAARTTAPHVKLYTVYSRSEFWKPLDKLGRGRACVQAGREPEGRGTINLLSKNEEKRHARGKLGMDHFLLT